MSFSLDSITNGITDYVKGAASKVGNVLDPSNARLSIAGLAKGGRKKSAKPVQTRVGFSIGNPEGDVVPIEQDWRVRIGVAPTSDIFYTYSNAGIMAPLKNTQGVVFPYTPSITISHSATYGQTKTTHSNYPAYFYEGSEVQAIQLSGDFTVQSVDEGQYLLACIYFFRAATKMFYGSGQLAGNPPPIVFLSGYGDHLLPNVPCVITSFQQVMSQEVDYIEIPSIVEDTSVQRNSGDNVPQGQTSEGKGRSTRLPAVSQLQVTLQPVYSRRMTAQFDLDRFAAGELIGAKSGGFL